MTFLFKIQNQYFTNERIAITRKRIEISFIFVKHIFHLNIELYPWVFKARIINVHPLCILNIDPWIFFFVSRYVLCLEKEKLPKCQYDLQTILPVIRLKISYHSIL